MYRLRHGKYVGVKQENFSDSVTLNTTDVCFYAPDLVDDCLQAETFLSYNRSGHEEMCYTNCQHKREDVFYDDDDRQQRIINFRMMPPDDKEDDAFVIRLYNNTVVWLMTSSCYSQPSVLSDIWKPRRYIPVQVQRVPLDFNTVKHCEIPRSVRKLIPLQTNHILLKH